MFDTVSRAEAFVCFAGDAAILPALDRYRSATGIAARLVVIAPDAVEAPLGEAGDPLVLQVLGFDAAVPGVVADFIRGPQAEA